MTPRVVYRPLARADLFDIMHYLGERNRSAAARFVRNVRADITALSEHPGMGARRTSRNARLKDLRSLPVTRYRDYLIFYIPTAEGIEIVRIIHGARRLGPLFREE